MGYISNTGHVIVSSGMDTNNLIKDETQRSEGVTKMRQIQNDQKEARLSQLQKQNEMENIRKLQEKTREVEDLKKKLRQEQQKSEVLRDLAADVIIDRSSIQATLSFLKKKWVNPTKFEEFEQDAENARNTEKQNINNDAERQDKAYQIVDRVSHNWLNPEAVHRRRPPKAKSPK